MPNPLIPDAPCDPAACQCAGEVARLREALDKAEHEVAEYHGEMVRARREAREARIHFDALAARVGQLVDSLLAPVRRAPKSRQSLAEAHRRHKRRVAMGLLEAIGVGKSRGA